MGNYEIEIHYLDVGQGDCSLIIVREDGVPKRTLVYDCGSGKGKDAGSALLNKIKAINELHTDSEAITKINIAVISHFDEDHFNGFTYLFKQALDKDDIKLLFSNTVLYTRGCIFSSFRKKDLDKEDQRKVETDSFLSAYYFEGSMRNVKTILRPYTNLLNAFNEFKSLDEGLEIKHVTQNVLAGFPTNTWSERACRKGEKTIYSKSWVNKSGNRFIPIDFKKGDYLIGKDLMNDKFKEDEIPIKLTCIAVNQYIDDRTNLLETTQPKKNGNTANNCSIGCLLTFSKFSAFFGGDLESEIENQLCPKIKQLTKNRGLNVLKASHHGSGNSTDTYFLEQLTPNTVIITCGPENTYEHPAIATIKRLSNAKQLDKVLISGFGIREKTSEKKDEEKRTVEQKEYDDNYDIKSAEYIKYGVPVGFNVYNPAKKFILTGGWVEPGDIKIKTSEEEANEGKFTLDYYHAFTKIKTEEDQRLLSNSQSIEMLIPPEEEKPSCYYVFNDDGTSLKSKRRRKKITKEEEEWVDEDVKMDGVNVEVIASTQGAYVRNGQKKRRLIKIL